MSSVVPYTSGLPLPTASGRGVRGGLLLPQRSVPHVPVYVSHGVPVVAEGLELSFVPFCLLHF